MNDDAESWIRLQGLDDPEAHFVRMGMRWAYADAAEILRQHSETLYAHARGPYWNAIEIIKNRVE